jgi:membrane-associated phospholipid phosphatase
VRSLRVQLAVLVAIGLVIRIAAFTIDAVHRLDTRILVGLQLEESSRAHSIAGAIASPFDPVPYLIVVAAVLVAAWRRGRHASGIVAAGVMLGSAATTQVLKHVLAAPRATPHDAYLSLPPDAWPSGHTTAAAALGFALVLITPPGRRRPVAIAAAAITVLVGTALVMLGRHFPSDVLGALCVAGAWGAIGFRALDFSRARPAAR